MESYKVLFVCSEIHPYLPESAISKVCKLLPPAIQEKGFEIRTFMPKFGGVNERRNQLHEVIRLSGLNLVINESDHPLIIKVASISSARMQIYFIDNEDYFQRKTMYRDENGIFFKDNDERAIFFARGVLETVRKLRWSPDIVHCHGWFTFLAALYMRKAFKDDPLYADSKIILSFYDEAFDDKFSDNFKKKALTDGVRMRDLDLMANHDYIDLIKMCVNYADGIAVAAPEVNKEFVDYAENAGKFVLAHKPEGLLSDDYAEFYNNILAKRRRRRK
jgi:starch synthase